MRGWVIKIYFDNGDFWGYKAHKDVVRSDKIIQAYIYQTKEMAEKVAKKHIALKTEIVEVEINEVMNNG